MKRARISSVLILAVLAITGCHHDSQDIPPQQEDHDIAILRDAYAAFNRGDIPAAVKSLDSQIIWTEPVEFPGGSHPYHGPAEVAGYLANSRANWAEGRSQPVKFLAHGNRIVVFVHVHARPKDSSTWNDVDLADVYTFRNDVPIEMKAFADRNAALRWAGINP